MSVRGTPLAIVVSATLAVACAGVALAGKAKSPVVKGGSYAGALAAPRIYITVNFRVSKDGKSVTGLKTNNLPFYCQGGGPPVPITFKSAPISTADTFERTGVQIISAGPKKGQKGATLNITGRFVAGRAESGKITTKFPASSGTSCNGSSTYSTKA